MATFHLMYNPFLVQASLKVKDDGKWVPIDGEAGLDTIYRSRLQHWLSEDGQTGSRVFDQLYASSGDEHVDILFSGTKEDLEDLCRTAERYAARNPRLTLTVQPFGGGFGEKYSSAEKFREFQTIIERSRRSPYWRLLPESVRDATDKAFLPMSAIGVMIELPLWETIRSKLFSPDAWQLAALRFRYDTMRERAMQQAFQSFSDALRANGNRELEQPRFMLLCQCDGASLSALPQTQETVRKTLLEYGIYDLDTYYLTEQEIVQLDGEVAANESPRFLAARNAIALYSTRYAEQIRLRKLCDMLQLLLRENGYAESIDLFRTMEDTVRRTFPSAKDEQVYAAYYWILDFSKHLNDFLES